MSNPDASQTTQPTSEPSADAGPNCAQAEGSAWPSHDEMMDEIEDMVRGICDRCGGEGFIEYNDGDGGDWGEDCPSELNHLIECRKCRGTGRVA